jgi:hypothetical protein
VKRRPIGRHKVDRSGLGTRFVVYTATAKLRRGGNGVETPSAVTGPTGDESF